jgi:leader peptidase (prepilin peptidase)/N-methyltransferase
MLISRFVTIFLIPISFVVSYFGYLPLSLSESIIGTLAGYCILKTISFIFFKLTHKEGLGEGDVDLLAFIGSWIGLVGVWATLLLASITGSIVGIIYMITTGRIKDSMNSKDPVLLPFGPFLALSAIAFIYFQVYCPVMSFLIS